MNRDRIIRLFEEGRLQCFECGETANLLLTAWVSSCGAKEVAEYTGMPTPVLGDGLKLDPGIIDTSSEVPLSVFCPQCQKILDNKTELHEA